MELKETCEVVEEISELRMIELLPHGIAEVWPELKIGIEMSLPPVTVPTEVSSRMTGILEALLSGAMTVHIFFKLIKNVPFSYGFIITAKVYSIESGHSNLLIYVFYGHRKMLTDGDMAKGIELIKKYARKEDCLGIIAYSKFKPVINLLVSLGFNADYTILMSEV